MVVVAGDPFPSTETTSKEKKRREGVFFCVWHQQRSEVWRIVEYVGEKSVVGGEKQAFYSCSVRYGRVSLSHCPSPLLLFFLVS
jgi:hypothetical protein